MQDIYPHRASDFEQFSEYYCTEHINITYKHKRTKSLVMVRRDAAKNAILHISIKKKPT